MHRSLTEEKKIEPSLPKVMSFSRRNDLELIDDFINDKKVDLDRLAHILLRPREYKHVSRTDLRNDIAHRFKDEIHNFALFNVRELIILGLYFYGRQEKELAHSVLNHLKEQEFSSASEERHFHYFLGKVYSLEGNTKEAYTCFQKAAELYVVEAHTQLGLMLLEENIKQAENHFILAAANGSNRAKFELGKLQLKLNISLEKINHLYFTSIQNGNYIAAAALGQRLEAEKNPNYILLYRKGCEDEHPDAIAAIGKAAKESDSIEVLYHCALAIRGFDYTALPIIRLDIQKKLAVHFQKSIIPFTKLFLQSGDTWDDLNHLDGADDIQRQMINAITTMALEDRQPGMSVYVRTYIERQLSRRTHPNILGYCAAVLQSGQKISVPEFIYHRALAVRKCPNPLCNEMLGSLETLIITQPRVVFNIFLNSGDTWETLSDLLKHSSSGSEIQSHLLRHSGYSLEELESILDMQLEMLYQPSLINTSSYDAYVIKEKELPAVSKLSLFHQAIVYSVPSVGSDNKPRP